VAVWRRPHFVRLWASQTISLLRSEVTVLALPLAAIALGAGPKEMGWLAAARFLPSLLLGLPAGVWVDRLPRRPLLIATDIGRGLVQAASAPFALVADVASFLASALLLGTIRTPEPASRWAGRRRVLLREAAADFQLPEEAPRAALLYYRRHRAAIEARVAENGAALDELDAEPGQRARAAEFYLDHNVAAAAGYLRALGHGAHRPGRGPGGRRRPRPAGAAIHCTLRPSRYSGWRRA
jgi:hypothetical protein